jgi:hypothetical protein
MKLILFKSNEFYCYKSQDIVTRRIGYRNYYNQEKCYYNNSGIIIGYEYYNKLHYYNI